MRIPYRFKIIFLSFIAVFICYIDRVNISVAIIPMQEQFGWSELQVGIVLFTIQLITLNFLITIYNKKNKYYFVIIKYAVNPIKSINSCSHGGL